MEENRESRNRLYTYGQLIFGKGTKALQWKRKHGVKVT